MVAVVKTGISKERKKFFFEKKNQKNQAHHFAPVLGLDPGIYAVVTKRR